MGSFQVILLACAATTALAHDISGSLHAHDVHNIPGYCHLDSPVQHSFPLGSTPSICAHDAHDNLTTKYQASPAATAPVWTRATSCTANGNGTEEYCVFTSATFAFGRGISVVASPQRADYLANLPAFADGDVTLEYENVEREGDAAPFKFVHVPGKDMGVVATRPIYRGDHLMSFTPAVVIDYGTFTALAPDEWRRLQAEAVDALPSRVKGMFLDLSTHDGAEGHLQRVEKILKTNAFDVDIRDESDQSLYVVFPESEYKHPAFADQRRI